MLTGTTHRLLAAGLATLLLSACGTTPEEPVYIERPPETIYNQALAALGSDDNEDAANLFAEVERQHPYSPWATQAQLMAAYAYYQETNYDEALLALDRFIQLHPGHENVDYAYYLRALCYYERIVDVERDQAMTVRAMNALREVIRLFPDSVYARDSQLKLDLTHDQLAGKEMTIGRWYLNQGQYNAAINRFLAVVRNYQTTTHTPEALHRLVEAYLALGLVEEAQQAAAVLGHNYPGSEWYLDSYADLVDEGVRPRDDRGFVQRSLDWLF